MGIETLKAAVDKLENSLEVLSPETHPVAWVSTQIDLARALHAWGLAAPAGEGWRLLQESVEVLQKTRNACSPQTMPESWIALHNALGMSLAAMAERAPGGRFHDDAVAAFAVAQEITVPTGAAWNGWRETQDRLIATLLEAAGCASDEMARTAYERQALEATKALFFNAIDQLRSNARNKRRARREPPPPAD